MSASVRSTCAVLAIAGLDACTLDLSGKAKPWVTLDDDAPAEPEESPSEAPELDAASPLEDAGFVAEVDSGAMPTAAAEPDSGSETSIDAAAMQFAITSDAVDAAGNLLPTYTCAGERISPPFAWSDPDPTAQSYALVMRQLGTGLLPEQVLWVLWDIPKEHTELPADLGTAPMPFESAKQVSGTAAHFGLYYRPPCVAQATEITFTLYVLAVPELEGASTLLSPAQVAQLIEQSGAVLGEASLAATVLPP